ncbi:hypothetical protein TWF694_010823 [Orbilia ellipsospora]|uniref:J domain-containing protein n=1 Tax=Orbilia ellipsospora TaxID=2528407 RepID=A0AAV9X8C3_9PEZI
MYVTRQSAAAILPKCGLLASCSIAVLPATPKLQSRRYASHADSNSPTALKWPSKSLAQLTPYEIFNQPHSSAYQKQTFYRLVKLYHPDCIPQLDHPSGHLSKTIRTERFRLIVAANALLADPTKKKAYDAYGVGWNGVNSHHRGTDVKTRTAAAYASGPWKNSPAGNATWEDWERWYKAEGMGGTNSSSSFTSGFPGTDPSPGSESRGNAATPLTTKTNFVTILLLLSFTGVLVQLARVDQFTSTYEERRDKRNRDIQRDLWRAKQDGLAMGGKDGRVQAFLKMRDPEGYGGVEEVREERLRRLLPEGEVCMSDGVRGRDVD